MKRFALLTALVFTTGLAACGSVETATRNAPLETPVFSPLSPTYSVSELHISVPQTLNVSEANLFFPVADIVWRGDVAGDRYQQVQSIFESGMGRGVTGLNGTSEVVVDIEVMRFHSLTEKARYTIGGVHSIKFKMSVYDAQTGSLMGAPRVVKADLDGFGGSRAIAAEQDGITQKVRIEQHLAQVIRSELAKPQV